MGADIADLDNDGNLEIFVTDMLPPDNARIKTVTTFDSWDRYLHSANNGYWHQFTRNTLQYNNGDDTFSEIGRYAGVEATDWSWAALIFDFQNDGLKDIFVSNGIYQDLTNQDFLENVTQDRVSMRITAGGSVDYEKLISYIPSVPLSNHGFINNGDMTFRSASEELGLGDKGFSNGAAYGDLDNDGDLDLITNNTNMPIFLYENKSESLYPENHFLRFVLKGEKGNTNALGTRISVHAGSENYVIEHLPSRGFQSTVDHRPLIGVGKNVTVDSIKITWPSGKITKLVDVDTDQDLILMESEGVASAQDYSDQPKPLFSELDTAFLSAKHTENIYSDFNRDKLIFQMQSTTGPCLCEGDINNDGLVDLYIGGAAGLPGEVYGQTVDGRFKKIEVVEFDRTKKSEDVDCTLFDANGDGFLDLYVASGGSEFNPSVAEMNDHLYFGDGNFNFTLVRQTLPANKYESSSVVKPADFDGDGDIDLFVGIRLKPFFYGEPMNGYILENDGSGNFKNVASSIAPDLERIGMINDASWSDLDNDNDLDLVVVGDWMPIAVFINKNGVFEYKKDLIPNSYGWWKAVEIADLNGDGYPDIIVGNHGLNTRFKASEEKPLVMFVKDFDRNGSLEQIICQYEGDKLYPLALKHDLASQIPNIRNKYKNYEAYMNQEITDVFSIEEIEEARRLIANDLSTSIYLSNGNLTYSKIELPMQVQFSETHAISIGDYNGDGFTDVLFGGNMYESKPEMGRYDASYGSLLIGDGTGGFNFMSVATSGLKIDGPVRKIRKIATPDGDRIVVVNNNDYAQIFRKNSK